MMGRIALAALVAIGALAACSGGTSQLPASRDALSWVDRTAKTGALVYISDQYEKRVFVYSYPALKLEGTLSGFGQPDGECVDAAGDVWITDLLAREVIEYAHGESKPKAMLSDGGNSPYACSVDPENGDLAVVNFAANPAPGSLSIFKKAQGTPQVYTDDSLAIPFFDAYDARGNLFIDGISAFYSPVFRLVRFAHKTFTTIALNQTIVAPGDVVVVGSRVNIGDSFRYTHAIYGFRVKGSTGRLIGVTHLFRSDTIEEFDVTGTSLVVTNLRQLVGSAMVFRYPNGGRPQQIFGKGTLEGPVGLVISK